MPSTNKTSETNFIDLLYYPRCSQQIITMKCLSKPTIIHKMFETNSCFPVKVCTMRKVQFLFFKRFLLILTKFSFQMEDLAPGNNSITFSDFHDIS